MYLVHYKGNCASIIINGIRFNKTVTTANISEERLGEFVSPEGVPYHDDIEVIKLEKPQVVPENKNEKQNKKVKLTVQDVKKSHSLEDLTAMCVERNLNATGSKTELAERITEFENSTQE